LFGYIKPYEEELKVRELQLFKAYYCGLCRTLGRTASPAARLSLNYDMVFLYLLLSSLEENPEDIRLSRCLLHPAAKRPFAAAGGAGAYCAHVNSMLIWLKLDDDRQDEHSIRARLAMFFFQTPIKKAQKKYPHHWDTIRRRLSVLSQLEQAGCASMDEAADPFAGLIGQVFAAPFVADPETGRALYWTGYNLGRWIYLLDAFDDLAHDLKKGCYNPVFLQFQHLYHGSLPDFIGRVRGDMEDRLIFTLDSAARSYELIPVLKNKGLLDNIIYLGMRKRTEAVLYSEYNSRCFE
jgi:hypothetical protein